MAKYLNSTGVSLLWNKIKELILDKIGSIVPFVYVSLDDNELSDSQKAHNLKTFNDGNYYSNKYIIFCQNNSIVLNGIGTKLYVGDWNCSYFNYDEAVDVEYDSTTGNLKSIGSREGWYINGDIIGFGGSNESYGDKQGIINDKRKFLVNYWDDDGFGQLDLAEGDIFFCVYLQDKDTAPIKDNEQLNNWKIVKYLEGFRFIAPSKTLVNCWFHIKNLKSRTSLGWIQENKVYVPDFEKSLFEVYEITETNTTRIDDMPFTNVSSMWATANDYNSSNVFITAQDEDQLMTAADDDNLDNKIGFVYDPGKESIFSGNYQFKTLPTNGKFGQSIICSKGKDDIGYNRDFIDVKWIDNYEQLLGNGLIINIPFDITSSINNVLYFSDTNTYSNFNTNVAYQFITKACEVCFTYVENIIFKDTDQAIKYKNRFNSLFVDNDYFYKRYIDFVTYEVRLTSNTSKTITFEELDRPITFNPNDVKEITCFNPVVGSMFIPDGNWFISIKSITFVHYKCVDIAKLISLINEKWPITREDFEIFIYPNLRDAISNTISKDESDELYATKQSVTTLDNKVTTINNEITNNSTDITTINNNLTTVNNRLDDQIPVKISYADGKIIFESESQKIAFPMANSYTTYDQYVTGFATGTLDIQEGTYAVPVDKNGRFKRVFPYDTTISMPLFNMCHEVTHLDMSRFDTKKITSFSHTFKDCDNLTYLNISGFDTSKVTGPTDFIFCRCKKLKQIDVSGWNTSGSTDMTSLFSGCESLEDIDVSNWNTSNVTSMKTMFQGCYALQELNVSNWNVSKVTNFFYTFSYMNIKTLNLGAWQNDVVTNLAGMFEECKVTSLNLSGFNTVNVTTMAGMFDGCTELQSLNLGNNWYMNSHPDVSYMFNNCTKLTTVTGTISNLKKTLDLHHCPLTNSSAMVFINGIAENGSGITLKFKKSTYDTLSAAQKSIATSKGATIIYA